MTTMYTTFEEALNKTGKLAFTNVGWSMLPLIREGRDVMQIRRCDVQELKKYDAVLFRRPGIQGRGAYVLHRILKRTPEGLFWIVGDNCTQGEMVRGEQILGVLTAVARGRKTVRMTDFSYRLYVALWCAPYPMRFAVLKLIRWVKCWAAVLTNITKKLLRRT